METSTVMGPRHKKLVQVYQKAMDMIAETCSIEHIKAAFPPIIGEEQGSSDDSVLHQAHSKMIKTFMEHMQSQWEAIISDMQVTEKLDRLDMLLCGAETDPQRMSHLAELVQPVSPQSLFNGTVDNFLQADIERLDRELELLSRGADMLKVQVSEKQKEIDQISQVFHTIHTNWDKAFQSATNLESNLWKSAVAQDK
jgi:hypothetical protein